jgi:hypothetical protein
MCLTFLNPLARREGSGLQLLQLMLRRVVGLLDDLRLGRQVPKSCPQAWKVETQIKLGANPERTKPTNEGQER